MKLMIGGFNHISDSFGFKSAGVAENVKPPGNPKSGIKDMLPLPNSNV